MAELADAPDSKSGDRKVVKVRLLSPALFSENSNNGRHARFDYQHTFAFVIDLVHGADKHPPEAVGLLHP